MAYQDSSNGALAPRKERLASRKSLSPNVSPRHSRRGMLEMCTICIVIIHYFL